MVSQIESFKQTSVPASKSGSKKTKESVEPGVLKYHMMYLPEKARLQEAARIAQLEQRLCCLENIIGTSNDKLSKFSQVGFVIISHAYIFRINLFDFSFFSQNLKCQGIMEAVQQLEAKATLLDVNQLDTIETRLGTLIYRMDSIAQKKATTEQESEQEQKVKHQPNIKINIICFV